LDGIVNIHPFKFDSKPPFTISSPLFCVALISSIDQWDISSCNTNSIVNCIDEGDK
jgi:hypothetical protein